MKVILLQNIKGIGRVGDIKLVSDGYGRNYLLPNRLAKHANDNAIKEVEALKKKAEFQEKVKVEMASKVADTLKDAVIEFTKKASDNGTLFASVTKEEVAHELSKIAGHQISEDMIDFDTHGEHIKLTGEHMITVELSSEHKVTVKVIIKAE